MGIPADGRVVNAENCTQESVREGLKAAAITCLASAVPTLAAVRTIPWAKANLNYTGQALIISGVDALFGDVTVTIKDIKVEAEDASIAAYFVTADRTILKAAKKNARYDRTA